MKNSAPVSACVRERLACLVRERGLKKTAAELGYAERTVACAIAELGVSRAVRRSMEAQLGESAKAGDGGKAA